MVLNTILNIVWSSDKIFFHWSTVSFAVLYTVAGLIFVSSTLFLYNRYSLWSRQGLKGPKPLPFVGNTFDYYLKPVKDVDIERVAKYGRIFGFYQGIEPSLCVSDPRSLRKLLVQDFLSFSGHRPSNNALLKNFLISKNGQEWKDMRSVMSPTFTSGKMKQMLPLMKESLVSMEKMIDKIIKDNKGEAVNAKLLFGCFTLDVIAKCAFATETNAHEDQDDPFVSNVRNFFSFKKWKIVTSLLLPNVIKDALNLTNSPAVSIEYLAQAAKQIMEQRRGNSSGKRSYRDLLELMMTAGSKAHDKDTHLETVDNEAHHGNEDENHKWMSSDEKKNLTDDEVIANIILVLVAGFDTTATTITYTSYALALNPHVQDKLREEVDQAFESNGQLSYEVLSGLKYLDAVISETLRMFPAVVRIERIAVQDYTLDTEDGNKIHIPKGSVVYVPIYAIHHDKEFYSDPEEYRPERFLPENKDQLIPYTYLPFVAGPRNCIGMRFALMEAKLAVANLVHKYRFKRVAKTAVPLDFSQATVLLQAKEVIVAIEKRN